LSALHRLRDSRRSHQAVAGKNRQPFAIARSAAISNAVDATNYVLWESGNHARVRSRSARRPPPDHSQSPRRKKPSDPRRRRAQAINEDLVVAMRKAGRPRRRDGRLRHDDHRAHENILIDRWWDPVTVAACRNATAFIPTPLIASNAAPI